MGAVCVVSTGVANIASVLAGIRRVGGQPELTEDRATIERAQALVLPGVGAFAAGMQRLRECGLVEVLQQRIEAGQPTLAVCLGLQMLCEGSEESPGVAGLGVLPLQVGRFAAGQRVPQLGWNRVEPQPGCQLLQSGYAYFANSYRLDRAPQGWAWASANYGGSFVAALERGSVLACQFHPELSGGWGKQLLARWLLAAGVIEHLPEDDDAPAGDA